MFVRELVDDAANAFLKDAISVIRDRLDGLLFDLTAELEVAIPEPERVRVLAHAKQGGDMARRHNVVHRPGETQFLRCWQ